MYTQDTGKMDRTHPHLPQVGDCGIPQVGLGVSMIIIQGEGAASRFVLPARQPRCASWYRFY